ncbi:MAG: ester cyclase [Actinomycetota bacterium]|nr:ester cyclase [Actinomycetota bacterium]
MSIEDNKRVVERFDALINTQELDQLEELCTPDMVNHTLAWADLPAWKVRGSSSAP